MWADNPSIHRAIRDLRHGGLTLRSSWLISFCPMSENVEFPDPAEDRRTEESKQIMELLLTATTAGRGTYEQTSFLAGASVGAVIATLSVLKAAGGTLTQATQIPRDLLHLADLIGMHFGYRALMHDAGDGGTEVPYAWIRFTNDPMVQAADE